jgi:hypothetical protein
MDRDDIGDVDRASTYIEYLSQPFLVCQPCKYFWKGLPMKGPTGKLPHFVMKLLLAVCVIIPSVAVAALSTADRRAQFERALAAALAKVTASTTTQERLIKQYLAGKKNKAQAVQLEHDAFWFSPEHEDEEVAAERTLEGCQLCWGGRPCALLVLNDDIVEGELVLKDMPRLNYVG